jgi:hypothetical protein
VTYFKVYDKVSKKEQKKNDVSEMRKFGNIESRKEGWVEINRFNLFQSSAQAFLHMPNLLADVKLQYVLLVLGYLT